MIPGARPVPRVHAPSIEAFRRDYERPRLPVVISGVLEQRTALQTWSFEHLATHGDVPVRVRISKRGEPQLFNGSPDSAFDFSTMPLRAALERIRARSDEVCYVQHGDLEAAPRLAGEIGSFDYLPRRFRTRSMLWVCGPGTINPLHWDTHHAALAQIRGDKRFVIFPPEDSAKLAPFSQRTLWRTTALDLSAIDRARFPGIDRASAWSCTVRPGEVLFIPYAWWHYMMCDEPSISVTWWWPPTLAIHLRDSAREHASSWVKRALRAFRRASVRSRATNPPSMQSPREH